MQPDGEGVEEVVADKGYHSDATLVALDEIGVTDARQATQQQTKVAARRLDEHPLADILVAAHPHPTETSGLVLVSERPLHQLPPASLETTASIPANTPTIPIQRRLRSTLLGRRLTRLLVLPDPPTTLRLRDVAA